MEKNARLKKEVEKIMENPFGHLLPAFMQFATLTGARFVLLVGVMMFFGSAGGRLFQKLKPLIQSVP